MFVLHHFQYYVTYEVSITCIKSGTMRIVSSIRDLVQQEGSIILIHAIISPPEVCESNLIAPLRW